MKKLLPFLPPVLLAVAMITACEKAPPVDQAANNDAEIERRVQERLASERQADQAKQLADKDAALQKKEQDLADREAALQKERDAATQQAQSTPSAPAAGNSDDDAPPAVVSNSSFYDALSPYGEWLQVPGRDYVWQPYAAQQSPNWRPYQQGRWAYTDQGWTWVSDEPFGWATYHYGRWTRLREAGWVWVPGDEWAPAWVSWRSSDDYVGWSPLPPQADFGGGGVISYDAGYAGAADFCFVPIVRFCEPRVATYIVAAQYNTMIINKTVNITNIVKVKNSRRVVINNNGPQAVLIQNKIGRPVRPLQIRAGKGGQNTQVTGNTLQVAVPPPSAPNRQRPEKVRPLPATSAPMTAAGRPSTTPVPHPAPPNETLYQRMQRERQQAQVPTETTPQTNPKASVETPEQQLRRQQRQRQLQQTQTAPALGQPTPAPSDDGRPRPLERGQRQQPNAEENAARAQQAAAQRQAVREQPAAQQRALQQQQQANQAARAERQANRAEQAQPKVAPKERPKAPAPAAQTENATPENGQVRP